MLSSLAINGFGAGEEAAIRATFVKPWLDAIQSKDPARVKRFFHPRVRACEDAQSREYFDSLASQEASRQIDKSYRVTSLEPMTGAPPALLPADSFSYPVAPTYEIQLDIGIATLVRYLAPANGSWFEVFPCPNEKGMAMVREQAVKSADQRKRVGQLAKELKDPVLSELKELIRQGRIIDAVKKYREATPTDLTTARMVVENLQAAK